MPLRFNPDTGEAFTLDDSGQWAKTKVAKNPDTGESFALDGGQWKKLPSAEANQQMYRRADAAMRGLAKGMTFGWDEEIAAGLRTLTGDKSYDENLAAEQARTRDAAAQSGFLPGTLIGGAATGIPGAAKVMGAKALSKVPSILKYGGLGATGGAVAGAGDSPGNRLGGAASGGAMGFGIGAGIPLAASALRATGAPLLSRMGPKGEARRKILQKLTDDGMSPEQAAARLRDLGPKGVVAEAGGENLLGLGRGAQAMPGPTKNRARELLDARQAGQMGRVNAALREGMGVRGQVSPTAEKLMMERKAAADPLYKAAVRPENLIPEQAFNEISADPSLSAIIKSVQKKPIYKLQDMPPNSMPVMDAAYKRLEDLEQAAIRAGKKDLARRYGNDRRMLADIIDEHFPDYGRARQAWSGPSRSLDALENGQKFMRGDLDMAKADFDGLSDGDKEFFRLGVSKAVRDAVAKSADGRNAVVKVFGSPMMRDKLAVIFPDKANFDRFARRMAAEARMSRTRQFILGGSPTARIEAEKLDVAAGAGVVQSALEGRKTDALIALLRAGRDRLSRPNQKVAEDLAKMLFSQDQKVNEALLKSLERRANYRRVGENLTGGVVTIGGGQAGLLSNP